MNRVGGRKVGWSLALAIACAAPAHAQDATDLPNINWSLSGKTSVRAPAQPNDAAAEKPAPAPARKAVARKRATVKKVATATPAPVVARTIAAPARPAVRTLPPPRPSVARTTPLATKPIAPAARPVAAKAPARPVVAAPPLAVRPPLPTPAPVAAPEPIIAKPAPVMPSPSLVEESEPALVTTRPLTPRKTSADDGSFGQAISAAASQAGGIPPLRSAVGIVSLLAALAALVAIWWQSVGARMWSKRRRGVQPRLMIDIPLAPEPEVGALAMGDVTLGRNGGCAEPGSSRLGDRAAAE